MQILRRTAFGQLIEGHAHFKVRPEAASGFVLDMLGEAFLSNREGSVSRAKLDGKILGVYFQGAVPSARLVKGLRHVHDKFQGGGGVGALEVIYVSTAATQEDFSKSFREMPWLAIPFAHAQRRTRLRELFEVSADSNQLILCAPRTGARTPDTQTLSCSIFMLTRLPPASVPQHRPGGAHHHPRRGDAG